MTKAVTSGRLSGWRSFLGWTVTILLILGLCAVGVADNAKRSPSSHGGGSSLPAMTGQGGKYLTNNGTAASWAPVSYSAASSATATTTTVNSPSADWRGSYYAGGAAHDSVLSWRLQPTVGGIPQLHLLKDGAEISGTTASSTYISGDGTLTLAGGLVGGSVYVTRINGNGVYYIYSSPMETSLTSTTIASNAISLPASGNAVIVSGSGVLKTITTAGSPDGGYSTVLHVLPATGSTWTTDTTGNIGAATTAIPGRVIVYLWDGASKWWPSY